MSTFRFHGRTLASRREVLQGTGIFLAAAATMLLASARRAFAKMTQKAALYQDKPKGGAKCATCEHFQPPASCEVVAGKINPNGWCQMYIKKT